MERELYYAIADGADERAFTVAHNAAVRCALHLGASSVSGFQEIESTKPGYSTFMLEFQTDEPARPFQGQRYLRSQTRDGRSRIC